MSRVSRAKQHGTAARRRQPVPRHAGRRNRILLAVGSIAAVVALALTFVLVRADSAGKTTAPSAAPSGAALGSVVADLTSVPPAVLDKVGAGDLATGDIGPSATPDGGYLVPITGPRLTAGGKPVVIYVGADFCPYCAAVRWPLIVALSRFGTFSGLATARSGVTSGSGQKEPYPASPTWTFSAASYTSPYVVLSAAEVASSVPDSSTGGYQALQTPTEQQRAAMGEHDPSGSIPFLDIGNAYLQMSVLGGYGPQELQGKTWKQITAAIRDPSNRLGRDIDASANYLTAAICTVTGNKPATACTPAVRALEPRLG